MINVDDLIASTGKFFSKMELDCWVSGINIELTQQFFLQTITGVEDEITFDFLINIEHQKLEYFISKFSGTSPFISSLLKYKLNNVSAYQELKDAYLNFVSEKSISLRIQERLNQDTETVKRFRTELLALPEDHILRIVTNPIEFLYEMNQPYNFDPYFYPLEEFNPFSFIYTLSNLIIHDAFLRERLIERYETCFVKLFTDKNTKRKDKEWYTNLVKLIVDINKNISETDLSDYDKENFLLEFNYDYDDETVKFYYKYFKGCFYKDESLLTKIKTFLFNLIDR